MLQTDWPRQTRQEQALEQRLTRTQQQQQQQQIRLRLRLGQPDLGLKLASFKPSSGVKSGLVWPGSKSRVKGRRPRSLLGCQAGLINRGKFSATLRLFVSHLLLRGRRFVWRGIHVAFPCRLGVGSVGQGRVMHQKAAGRLKQDVVGWLALWSVSVFGFGPRCMQSNVQMSGQYLRQATHRQSRRCNPMRTALDWGSLIAGGALSGTGATLLLPTGQRPHQRDVTSGGTVQCRRLSAGLSINELFKLAESCQLQLQL